MLKCRGGVCERATNVRRAGFACGRTIRRIAVAAIAAIGLSPAGAIAGNISLSMSGIASPMDVASFHFSASKQADLFNTVYPTQFSDVLLTVAESAVTPLVWVKAAGGSSIASMVLTLLSPGTARPTSDWTFTNAQLTSANASATANVPGFSTFALSLSAGTVTYRVYAADGSVAQQTCWNVATGAAC